MKRRRCSSCPATPQPHPARRAPPPPPPSMTAQAAPNEILFPIFCGLDALTLTRCRAVCRRWRDVADLDAVLLGVCLRHGLLRPGQTLEQVRYPALCAQLGGGGRGAGGLLDADANADEARAAYHAHRRATLPLEYRLENPNRIPQDLRARLSTRPGLQTDFSRRPSNAPLEGRDCNAHGWRQSPAELAGRPPLDLSSYRHFMATSFSLADAWPASAAARRQGDEPTHDPVAKVYTTADPHHAVWRFAIDHTEGVIVSTLTTGYLHVVCLSSGKRLFSKYIGTRRAKLAVSCGWVIHDCRAGFVVWRFEQLSKGTKRRPVLAAERGRLQVVHRIRCSTKGFPRSDNHVHDQPFRFRFPYLVTLRGNYELCVYDVPSGCLLQRIPTIILGPNKCTRISVDFDQDFIFVVARRSPLRPDSQRRQDGYLQVYSRKTARLCVHRMSGSSSLETQAAWYECGPAGSTLEGRDAHAHAHAHAPSQSQSHWAVGAQSCTPQRWNQVPITPLNLGDGAQDASGLPAPAPATAEAEGSASWPAWDAVAIDEETSSLCLYSSGGGGGSGSGMEYLLVIPEYRARIRSGSLDRARAIALLAPWSADGQRGGSSADDQRVGSSANDQRVGSRADDQPVGSSFAVGGGRATFIANTQRLILVDLSTLIAQHLALTAGTRTVHAGAPPYRACAVWSYAFANSPQQRALSLLAGHDDDDGGGQAEQGTSMHIDGTSLAFIGCTRTRTRTSDRGGGKGARGDVYLFDFAEWAALPRSASASASASEGAGTLTLPGYDRLTLARRVLSVREGTLLDAPLPPPPPPSPPRLRPSAAAFACIRGGYDCDALGGEGVGAGAGADVPDDDGKAQQQQRRR